MPQNKQSEIRVRYAPSPTGHWHVGGVRVVLYNWLYARKTGGTFIVRIEDTDQERSKREFELEIFDSLRWLGLDYDEGPIWTKKENGATTSSEKGEYGPYHQSERRDIYRNYLTQLTEKGRAYYCYCTKEDLEAERQLLSAQGLPPKYGGHCRNLTSPPVGKKPETIRFRIPETVVKFHDLIRGDVSFDASLFGDIVIAKDLDNPLYNFAVVVDDELMHISHVIRGEEHLSNTPKQILFQKALGFRAPEYAHFPLILNPDRSKMSKRYGETTLSGYRDTGYLPEAMVNFFLLQGWHPKDNREVMTPHEAAELFEFKDVQKTGAV
ncbi:MAG: glutamate--tRNA ligase, partial [Patescibacteria group bacterium]